jgi:hypothetical protein
MKDFLKFQTAFLYSSFLCLFLISPLNAQEDDPSFKNADAEIIEKIEVYLSFRT